jgi:hypothetical protein
MCGTDTFVLPPLTKGEAEFLRAIKGAAVSGEETWPQVLDTIGWWRGGDARVGVRLPP